MPNFTVEITEAQLSAAMDIAGYSHVTHESRREGRRLYGNVRGTTVEVVYLGTTKAALTTALRRTLPVYMQGFNIPTRVEP